MVQDVYKTVIQSSIRVFLLCCELKNFTSAARVLNMTPSAVSKAISTLEAEIGCTLFDRRSRPLALTGEARLLRDSLRQMLSSVQDVVTQIGIENHVKPVLRLGILESLTNNLGAALIRRLRPFVSEISVMTASADLLKQFLIEQKLDLIITNDAVPESEKNIFCRHLLTEPSLLVLPKNLENQSGGPWTWEELACCGLPYVRYMRNCGAGQVNERFFAKQNIVFPDTISVYANSLLMTLVAEGLGWTLARPCTILEMKHLQGKLAIYPCPKPVLCRSIYLEGFRDMFAYDVGVIYDICLEELRSTIVPELIVLAPEIESMITIGSDDQNRDPHA